MTSSESSTQSDDYVQIKTVNVGILPVEPPRALVLFSSMDDQAFFPLVVGVQDATNLKLVISGVKTSRPITYELIFNILTELGVTCVRGEIDDDDGEIYYATLVLSKDGREYQIDARPSDCVGIAAFAKAPIFIKKTMLDKITSNMRMVTAELAAIEINKLSSSNKKQRRDE